MTKIDLDNLRQWFSEYVRSFYSGDNNEQKNIFLKEKHTYEVCANAKRIAGELFLTENERILSETIALFHDIGRFPQYARFKTFNDRVSVNHGLLGAQILEDEEVLSCLGDNERELIIKAVKFHNAFSIPKNEKDEIVFFIKLIRDADKLDIWRVFLEYYYSPSNERASAVGLGLPDAPEYSKDIISNFYDRRPISLLNIRSLNDFKLLQLSWIFDLNFKPSFKILLERKYIDYLISHLPQTEEIKKISFLLKDFVEKKLQ